MKRKILFPILALVLALSLSPIVVAENPGDYSVAVTISALPPEVASPGDPVQLTITETNDGTISPCEPAWVVLEWPGNTLTLNPDPYSSEYSWSSNVNDNTMLGRGEIWTWTLTVPIYECTPFVATGHGIVPECGLDVTDQQQVTVCVGPAPPPPPPVECGPCEGGVTSLTLQYNGTTAADVIVKAKKNNVILFDDTVLPGGMFTVVGADKHGKLGSEIKILVDGVEYTKIHTSCSQPIGIGMAFGDFEIVGGESLKGGAFCPSVD